MDLFENSEPEELPLFVRYFRNNIKATGETPAADRIQYMYILLSGDSLHEFETLVGQIGCTNNRNLTQIIFGLGTYLFPINSLSKKHCLMCHRMRKSHTFKIRWYVAHIV